MSTVVLFLGALMATAVDAGAQSTATLKGVDLYRSSLVTLEGVTAKLGASLETYARLRGERRPGSQISAQRMKDSIESSLRRLGRFAYARVDYAEYVTSSERSSYVTLDVVDAQDAKVRLPSRRPPKGRVSDPDGLLAAWQSYAAQGAALTRQGLAPSERPACPGFYCSWGGATPAMAELERRFPSGAERQRLRLLDVLRRDADPARRAAAVYVLSYLSDAKALTEALYFALDDPAEDVRAAALQVFSDVALYHKQVFIEVNRLIPLIDFPTISDRSKAMGVLIGLIDNPSYRPYVLTRCSRTLVGLLKLKQPSNHDLAFTLLSMLSQEPYAAGDVLAWERWATLQSTSTATPR